MKDCELRLHDLLTSMSSHVFYALHMIDCDGTSRGTWPTSG